MGAYNWEYTITATNQEQFACRFSQEVKEDRHENGCGTYNGTIGQKSTYRLVSRTPVTVQEFQRLKERHEGEKWDDFAMACPIVGMEPFGRAKTFTVTVDVQPGWNTEDDARSNGIKQLGLTNFEIIGDVTVQKMSDAEYKVVKDDEFKTGWKVRYCSPKADSELFKTKAEAVKAAKKAVASGEKWAQAFNDGGVFKRVLAKPARYKVSFKYKETRSTGKTSHYQVWGWAAC